MTNVKTIEVIDIVYYGNEATGLGVHSVIHSELLTDLPFVVATLTGGHFLLCFHLMIVLSLNPISLFL